MEEITLMLYEPPLAYQIDSIRVQFDMRQKKCLIDVSTVDFDSAKHLDICDALKQNADNIFAVLELEADVKELHRARRDVENAGWIVSEWSYGYRSIIKHIGETAKETLQDQLRKARNQPFFEVSDEMLSLHEQWADLFAEIEWANANTLLIYRARCFPKEQRGFVYLFKLSTGHYKIGLSKNPQRRGREIISGLPLKLDLVHQIPSNQIACLEDELHRKYKTKRHEGTEWFSLDEADVADICAITECDYEWIDNPKWEKFIRSEYAVSKSWLDPKPFPPVPSE